MTIKTFRKAAILAIPLFLAVGCSKGDEADQYASKTDSASPQADAAKAPMAAMKSMGSGASAMMQKAPMANSTRAEASSTGTATLASAPIAPSAPQAPMRQVIRHAELEVRVGNVEKAEKAVGSIVQSAGGYTENASSTDLATSDPRLTLALRVPVGSFDSCISKFEALGVRLSKKIGSEDVTGQLVDLDARLKTLREQEEVYREMLRKRSQMSEIFELQSQLTQIRTQIETIAGQRKSQGDLAAMSTISLTLEQNAIANRPSTDPNWMAQTWGEASSGAAVSLRIFFVGLVWVLAFSPFWIPLLLLLRRAIKPLVEKKPVSPPVQY